MYRYTIAQGRGPNGKPKAFEVNGDGLLLTASYVVASKTKPLEATAAPGATALSALTWAGGTLANPTSIYCEAPSGNAAAVKLGAIGGSGGVSVEPGLSVTIDFPDPTLWEIRVGAGDSAKLTATEPV